MSLSEYKCGAFIYREGEPMSQLMFITNGSAQASFEGRTFLYEQGDLIGVCDLSLGIYSCTYTAASDVTITSYPYKNLSALETLLQENPGVAYLSVCSICCQIVNLLQYKIALKKEAGVTYEAIGELYLEYERLCLLYGFDAKELPFVTDLSVFSELDPIDEWVYTYYIEIREMDPAVHKAFFSNKSAIALGFLRNAAEDALNAIQTCKDYRKYIKDISSILLNDDENDLFALISELYFAAVHIKDASDAIEPLMTRLINLLPGISGIDPAYLQTRLHAYYENLEKIRTSKTFAVVSDVKQNLTDSLNIIIDYADCSYETSTKFLRSVQAYTMLRDKCSADRSTYELRQELTALFYELYTNIFIKSLKDPSPPTIIKMFLNFGYVDAGLAGLENAEYLYTIANSLRGDPDNGVYTINEWLAAIYHGQKEPCRSELDEDFNDYIRGLRSRNKIDDKEMARLLEDQEEKLRFELKNIFPVTNKITHGTISTFCPLFSSHNVYQQLDALLVTPSSLKETFNEILSIDFSAYYREVVFPFPELGTAKELLHIEVLPDIILMPNIGTRGVMWQEIEGKNRTTPSRMVMPLFLHGDLKSLIIRLTGEFRWEMCKRVQGMRWNDITDHSLTSDFSNYLQFYKSNRDLSPDAKESIKKELIKARNSFKGVFSSYYTDWILHESNGSLRLNKHVRQLMSIYCPLSSKIRVNLKNNLQFAESLNRYEVKQKQRVKHLSNLIHKITRSGKDVPQELLAELDYAQI